MAKREQLTRPKVIWLLDISPNLYQVRTLNDYKSEPIQST